MKALRISWIVVFALCALILLARGASASGAEGEELPTLSLVLARYVEAVGGRDAVENLETRVCQGLEIDDRPHRGPVETSRVEAYGKMPDRTLTVVHGPDGVACTGCDGWVGWHTGPTAVRLEESERRSRTAWLLDPQGPVRLEEYFPGMHLAGRGVVEGQPVYVVECDRDTAHYALYFDTETGLLIRVGYYWSLGDYREVDGVMVPFQISGSRKGGSTTFVFAEVVHDVPLEDNLFHMPPVVGAPSSK